MKILFVSAEMSPLAKVGGLADVAGSLPRELHRRGHDVRIAMPHYAMVDGSASSPVESVAASWPVPINGNWMEVGRLSMTLQDGVPVYLVGHDRWFTGAISSERIYLPGIEQYLFFSAAVGELPHTTDWMPDVVHANDWHTGFVPVLMRERHAARYVRTAAVFTIHNLAYQGEFGPEILDAFGISRSRFIPELLETWGGVNFLKSGCAYSDQVNTVSPTYAREIQTAEFGCKLEGLMRHLSKQGRLSGILNGIDTEAYDPARDRHLPAPYSVKDRQGKRLAKQSLLERLGLPVDPEVPLIGAVTRISNQKGLNLLAEAAPKIVDMPARLVVQGLGDETILEALRALESRFGDRIRVVERFDEDLAHQIYGGSDLFVMPSLFEPCGLGQMIAMRYGAIPIVRSTGGLRDTVTDGRNGFSFEVPTAEALADAVRRAIEVFRAPEKWDRLIEAAMSGDYGWERSASAYVELYETALAARESEQLKLA